MAHVIERVAEHLGDLLLEHHLGRVKVRARVRVRVRVRV
jgi:hypothetical protein